MRCEKLNFWSTLLKTDVPYMFYTNFHLPRPIFDLSSWKCTCIDEWASINFSHRWWVFWDAMMFTWCHSNISLILRCLYTQYIYFGKFRTMWWVYGCSSALFRLDLVLKKVKIKSTKPSMEDAFAFTFYGYSQLEWYRFIKFTSKEDNNLHIQYKISLCASNLVWPSVVSYNT